MTILALVMGAMFGILRSGIKLYDSGTQSVELYQSARVAMRNIMDDLQFALSARQFWQLSPRITWETPEQIMERLGGMAVIEEDPGAIRFIGSQDSVTFARKVYQFGDFPPFDIQECRFIVSEGNLYLDIIRSLLEVKRATWYYYALFEIDGARPFISYSGGQQVRIRPVVSLEAPPLAEFLGDYGHIGRRILIAEGIESVRFRYSDGGNWSGSWDSERVIVRYRMSPNSPNFDAGRDTVMQQVGPPSMIELVMTLRNGDTLATITEVPSGSMRAMGASPLLSSGSRDVGSGFAPQQPQQPQQPQLPPQLQRPQRPTQQPAPGETPTLLP